MVVSKCAGQRDAGQTRPPGTGLAVQLPRSGSSLTSGGRIDPGCVPLDDALASAPCERCPDAAHFWPPGPTPPCSLQTWPRLRTLPCTCIPEPLGAG